jgi:hypothetical protein
MADPYRHSYRTFMTKPVASAPTISLKVRRLEASDVADYRELRLESLKAHPEAFSSSWESEEEKPISWWAERLETATVFGGWPGLYPGMVSCRPGKADGFGDRQSERRDNEETGGARD